MRDSSIYNSLTLSLSHKYTHMYVCIITCNLMQIFTYTHTLSHMSYVQFLKILGFIVHVYAIILHNISIIYDFKYVTALLTEY